MEKQHEQYEAPELKLVGETSEVVLGGLGLGGDMSGQWTPLEMEFETD